MIQSEKLKEHARRLRLYNIANRMDSILHHAQEEKPTYPEFLSLVLGTEVEMKERKDYERRLVAARLPRKHDLDEYDYNFYEGIDRRQMKELRELVWLREAYNLILMGPSGLSLIHISGINKNYDQNGCHHTGKYPPQTEGFSCLFRYLVFLFESLQCFLRIQLVLLIVVQDKVKAFFIRGSHTLLF